MTLHPEGKQGVNIAKGKYDTIRTFILQTLQDRGDLAFTTLCELANAALGPTFPGKVTWYVVSVKLDLEARQLIERIPKSNPQRLRLSKQPADR